ncbi:hypothetical protein [Rosistilla oblonga]|uniref:hypothetical protein n=1 Tax=Rosistilla oblonga TaxID=2527990 RepID=UPI003A987722
MLNSLLLFVLMVLPQGRDMQWRVTFELETNGGIVQRSSVIADRGQTLRDVLEWKHIEMMESKGYTLIGIERVAASRKVPAVPTKRQHKTMDHASKYEEWLEGHRKSQDGPLIGNGG